MDCGPYLRVQQPKSAWGNVLRIFVVLLFVLTLAACDSPAPAVGEVCNEAVLVEKIEKFGVSAARLTERSTSVTDAETAASFRAFAARIGEKSLALRTRTQEHADDRAYTAELCKDYDELQAIVDKAVASGPPPPVETTPPKDG